jgi:hypothetical protein
LGTVSNRSPPERSGNLRAAGIRSKVISQGCQGTSTGMVRVIVNLRLDQYNELFRHVCEIGSTMSGFCRESAMKAMTDEKPDTAPLRKVRLQPRA